LDYPSDEREYKHEAWIIYFGPNSLGCDEGTFVDVCQEIEDDDSTSNSLLRVHSEVQRYDH
jgi:hypothetical protein